MDKYKVLFVRPSGHYVSLQFPDGPMVGVPRSLLYLAGVIKDLPNIEMKLVDALAHPDFDYISKAEAPFRYGLSPEEVINKIDSFKPDLIAISNMANYFFHDTVDLTKKLIDQYPDAFVLLGGPDPTSDYKNYFKQLKGLDAIIYGEGEETFFELVENLKNKKEWRSIPGIISMKNDDFIEAPSRPLLQDLDRYLPYYDLVDMEQYFKIQSTDARSRITYNYPGIERTVDMVTTRGCPFKCSFCSIHIHMGRTFRFQSPEAVLNEIELLITKYGVKHIHFEDDIINFDRTRFHKILNGLIEKDWDLTWDCPNGLRADLLDKETVELCAKAKCSYLVFGVESGNQRVLEEIVNKELRVEKVKEAAQMCKEAGLDTLAFYIIGFPGETREEARETYKFSLDLLAKYGTTPILQVWRPYRLTDLERKAKALNQVHSEDILQLHNKFGIPYTLFRDEVFENSEMDIEFIASLFKTYTNDLTKLTVFNWVKFVMQRPNLIFRFISHLSQVALDVSKEPKNAEKIIRDFIFKIGLYPRAFSKNLGVKKKKVFISKKQALAISSLFIGFLIILKKVLKK